MGCPYCALHVLHQASDRRGRGHAARQKLLGLFCTRPRLEAAKCGTAPAAGSGKWGGRGGRRARQHAEAPATHSTGHSRRPSSPDGPAHRRRGIRQNRSETLFGAASAAPVTVSAPCPRPRTGRGTGTRTPVTRRTALNGRVPQHGHRACATFGVRRRHERFSGGIRHTRHAYSDTRPDITYTHYPPYRH